LLARFCIFFNKHFNFYFFRYDLQEIAEKIDFRESFYIGTLINFSSAKVIAIFHRKISNHKNQEEKTNFLNWSTMRMEKQKG
jgi:hypothetical protein